MTIWKSTMMILSILDKTMQFRPTSMVPMFSIPECDPSKFVLTHSTRLLQLFLAPLNIVYNLFKASCVTSFSYILLLFQIIGSKRI